MAEDEDELPALLAPSAAGQEPPLVGPGPTPTPVGAAAAATVFAPGAGPPAGPASQSHPAHRLRPQHPQQRVHLGRINISSSGGRIQIHHPDGRGGVRVTNIARRDGQVPNGNGNGNGSGNGNGNGGTAAGAAQRMQQQNSNNNFRNHQQQQRQHSVNAVNAMNHPRHQQHRAPGPFDVGAAHPVLPPLEPRPLPHQSGEGAGAVAPAAAADDGGAQPSEKDMKRFECAICFEYMDRPSGCGSCQTRFCQQCLHRVLREQANNRPPNSTDPPNSAKCPHCRSFFTLQTMVPDITLQNEITRCTETVTCPFAGCGKELQIGLLKSHEETCPYLRVRCRYADWGCGWTGRRMDLERHDARECEFRGGLGALVERFRQGDARAGHILQQHHMQIGATNQMLGLHARQLMMVRGRNAADVLDVARLAYEASLFPGRFSAMREVWSGMINSLEARCIMCNAMLLVPSLLLVLRVFLRGFQLISNVRLDTLSEVDMWHLTDLLLLSLIVAMLGVLCLVCFFIDAKGSTGWTIYNVRHFVPGQPILRDLAAVCMAAIHFSAIEFSGIHPGVMHWHCVAVLTAGYAPFVARIIEKNAAETSEAGTVASARAWPVAGFGLRYGLAMAACGFAPTANAVALLRLCRQVAGLSPRVTAEDTECFLPQVGGAVLWAISSLITAFVYRTMGSDVEERIEAWSDAGIDLAIALPTLLYVNGLVYLLGEASRKLGESNFHVGNNLFIQAHRASGAMVPNIHPTTIGCSVFAASSFLLLCIATG